MLVELAIVGAGLALVYAVLRRGGSNPAPPAPRGELDEGPEPLVGEPGEDDPGLALADLLEDMVVLIDRDGTILRANRAFVERVGGAALARGAPLARFLEKGEAPLREDGAVALAIRTGRPAAGSAGPCALGEHLRITAGPLLAPGEASARALAVVIRDVSELRVHEDSARRLGHLVGALPFVVIEADPVSHRIRFVNGTYLETFGCDQDVLTELEIDALLAPGEPPAALREVAFRDGGGLAVLSLRRLGGSVFPARVHGTLLRKQSGAPDELVLMIEDLTEERARDEQVLRAQKLATLGELAATVTHEISSPLMSVLTGAELIEADLATGGPRPRPVPGAPPGSPGASTSPPGRWLSDEAAEAAADCLEGARRIAQIVEGVRRFAYMGKRGASATSFETAIESAVAVARSRFERRAKLIRPTNTIPEIWADPGHLAQVLMNLLVNAAQALEDAGRTGTIRFEQGVTGAHGYLRVIDDGPGIPDDVKVRLFRDYVTTKEPGRGTGFGLHISRKLIEEAQGTIEVESELGRGTTFTLTLPLAAGRSSDLKTSGPHMLLPPAPLPPPATQAPAAHAIITARPKGSVRVPRGISVTPVGGTKATPKAGSPVEAGDGDPGE